MNCNNKNFSFATDATHFISIWQPQITKDNIGGQIISWTKLSDVYAIIKPKQNKEQPNQKVIRNTENLEITIQYQADLANNILIHQSQVEIDNSRYNIISISHFDDSLKYKGKEYHILQCQKIT